MAVVRESVIYVHGLWSPGAYSLLLRRRLARALDCEVRAFGYASITSPMGQVIDRLRRFAAEQPVDRMHLVGHSLGGLVIYRLLERFPDLPPGRVVFLGTPAVASRAAAGLGRLRWLAPIAGKCVREELLVPRERRWTAPRELGIIAGTRGLGLGHLVARLEGENDGIVSVSETRLPGATDFVTLPATHLGLLVAARAAQETATFLREGHFAPARRPSASSLNNVRSS